MYKCGICKTQSQPNEKAFRVVVETRSIIHPPVPKAHVYKDANGRLMERDDPGGVGTAIVREVIAHFSCAQKAKAIAA